MQEQPAGKLILFNDAALVRDAALDGDGFGLEDRLSPIYRAVLSKDTHTPFSVMFSGGWGTGKTSAMRWMDAYLRKEGTGKNGNLKIDTCWFYPWKYQDREDVWKGLIAEVILATMDFEKVDADKVLKAARQFGKFLGGGFVRLLSGVKLSSSGKQPSVQYDLKDALGGVIEEYGKHVTPQNAYFNAFEQSLKEWVETCYKTDKSRLVLFIDDLDRCLPAIALQVLEAIKLYLNIPEVVVVVGVDRQVIDASVVKHYKDALGEGDEIVVKARQYLDKMFQVEVPIAPLDHRVNDYITGQLDNMEIWHKLEENHQLMFKDAIRQIADKNPRSVVRALNTAIVGAGTGKNPLEIAQAIQAALIRAVLQRQPDTKFHDLCLDKDGRSFFNMWTRAVIANPKKRRILADVANFSSPDHMIGSDRGAVVISQPRDDTSSIEVRPESDAADVEHLEVVAKQFPRYRSVMQIDLLRNLIGIEFLLEPEDAEENLKSWAHFQRLIAQRTGIADSEVTPEFLSGLPLLDLSGTEVTDAGLVHVKGMTSLKHLYLSGTAVTDAGLVHLKGLKTLMILDLDETSVTDAGLVHMRGLTSLKHLYLNRTKVSDAGLIHLGDIPSLRAVQLTSTQITDAGLSNLKKLKALTGLSLSLTQVTDLGLVHLSDLKSLDFLALVGTRVTDAGLVYLQMLTSLRDLHVNFTAVTDIGLANLKRALPELRINSAT